MPSLREVWPKLEQWRTVMMNMTTCLSFKGGREKVEVWAIEILAMNQDLRMILAKKVKKLNGNFGKMQQALTRAEEAALIIINKNNNMRKKFSTNSMTFSILQTIQTMMHQETTLKELTTKLICR